MVNSDNNNINSRNKQWNDEIDEILISQLDNRNGL